MAFLAHAAQNLRRGITKKNVYRALGISVGVLFILLIPRPARAAFSDILYSGISYILYVVASGIGKLTVLLFGILVQVAQYNDFLNAEAVQIGWRIVRDLCNMFFILVLLVIAFGTVFRYQPYRYNTLLRRLLIMAVLINFSNLIAGFFIDLTQVIMMTFVNAFADTAGGNLTTALGIDKILQVLGDTGATGAEVSALSVAITILLGAILITIAFVVILVYVVMLLARIIALWVLIILSPAAYLLSTFPSTRSWSSQWWRMFWQYASVGPILAFFLWLTLTIAQGGNASKLITSGLPSTALNANTTFDTGGTVAAALSEISSESGILGFMVSIILLVASLIVASKTGAAGGALAGRAAANIQRTGMAAARMPMRAAGAVARGTYEATLQRPAEAAAIRLGGALASTRVFGARLPFSEQGLQLQARVTQAQRQRQEREMTLMRSVNDDRVLASYANGREISPRGRARQQAARRLAPGTIQDNQLLLQTMENMTVEDMQQISSSRKYRLADRIHQPGFQAHVHGNPRYSHLPATAPVEMHDMVSENLARWVVQSASPRDKRALGYQHWEWDRTTNAVRPRTGAPTTAIVPDNSAIPNYNQYRAFADIDKEKLRATREVIDKEFGGKDHAEEFYRSSRYHLNPDQFVSADELKQALTPQGTAEETRRVQTQLQREQRALDRVSLGSSVRQGGQGRAATVAANFGTTLGALGLGSIAGAHLTGDQQKQAAGIIADEHRAQREAEVAGQRQQREEAEIDRRVQEFQTSTEELGRVMDPAEVAAKRASVTQQVKADGQFQAQLNQEAATARQQIDAEATEIRNSLTSASSLNLINKGRAGRSARQVIRHEQAHDAVDAMSDQQLQEQWSQLAPERRQEIEQYIRSKWQGGESMPMREVQEEFLTEVLASHGRGDQVGPLRLNTENRAQYDATQQAIEERHGGDAERFFKSKEYRDGAMKFLTKESFARGQQEEALAEKLGSTVGLNKQERARFEVDRLSKEGVNTAWGQLPPERQRAIESHMMERWEENFGMSDKEKRKYTATRDTIQQQFGGNATAFYRSNAYLQNKGTYLKEKDFAASSQKEDNLRREFLAEALASHRGGKPNTYTNDEGETVESPLNFQKNERDLALLVHAAASGKRAAPSAPVSVSELRPQTPSARVAPRPAGEQRITAQPPTRIVERAFEAKPSPVVQTNVVQNTTIQSMAQDFSRKIAGRIESLPSRGDMEYFLNQLQGTILDVARTQGIEQKHIQQLTTEIDQLKLDVQSRGEERSDQEALQTNFRKILTKYMPRRSFEDEEYPSARDTSRPSGGEPVTPPAAPTPPANPPDEA